MVIYRRDDQNNISNNNIDLWKLYQNIYNLIIFYFISNEW